MDPSQSGFSVSLTLLETTLPDNITFNLPSTNLWTLVPTDLRRALSMAAFEIARSSLPQHGSELSVHPLTSAIAALLNSLRLLLWLTALSLDFSASSWLPVTVYLPRSGGLTCIYNSVPPTRGLCYQS